MSSEVQNKRRQKIPAEHVEAVSEYDAAARLNVGEAYRTLKRLGVFDNVAVLGSYEGVVVRLNTANN